MNRPFSTATQDTLPPVRDRASGELAGTGGEQFDWNLLVPWLVHPVKVLIVEALWWIGEPVSPTDLTRMLGSADRDAFTLSLVAYHAKRLSEGGVLAVARRTETGRNLETFYVLVVRP